MLERRRALNRERGALALRALFWAVAGAALFIIPARLVLDVAAWREGRDVLFPAAGGAVAFLAAAVALELAQRRRVAALVALPLAFLGAFGTYALGLLLLGEDYSRRHLLTMLVAGAVVLVLSRAPRWLLGAAAVAGMVAIAWLGIPSSETTSSGRTSAMLVTAYEWLDVRSYPNRLPAHTASGGALAPFGDGYLLVTGDGALFRLRFIGESDSLAVEPLATRVPINSQVFGQRFGGYELRQFRVADLMVQEAAGKVTLFASHHYWKPDPGCFVVRVSRLDATPAQLVGSEASAEWSTLFESKPCMPVVATARQLGFLGMEVGGSMIMPDDTHVLLALGHHGFDGIDSPLMVSQDSAYDFGKTMLIDLRTGEARRYTWGHRNPQGLARTADGSTWLSEHGPRGGDELNLVVASANYGWPLETYGTQYGKRNWPLAATPGEHETYRAPVFAWVPSVGLSGMFAATGRAVPAWRGDLLVGSLIGESLWRVRVRHGRVVFTERIPLRRRIRDVAEGNDGRILLWANESEIIALRPSRVLDEGQQLFASHCAACHQLGDGTAHGIGPDLAGVFGRRVAGAPGFQYSPALRQLSGVWERERLASFLRDPAAFAPGNAMNFPGLADSAARNTLAQFLSDR